MASGDSVREIFGRSKALIGMLHLEALPGTPNGRLAVEEIAARAVAEAEIYRAAGFHGLLIENMHDRPFVRGGGPEVVAAMAVVAAAVSRETDLPLGIQILAAANREALAVAHAAGARFVRVEGFVFAHVADEGLIEASAGELLRYRRAIGAERVGIFADVKKKHAAHALTADVDLVETARAAELFLADGVIVTGDATGGAADPREVQAVAEAVALPTLVGSGLSADNLGRYAAADAFIVGSSVTESGVWSGAVDPARCEAMMRAFAEIEGR